ncbi:hypothetical protein BJX64DRAFT_223061 [Aspergillus heterothallicus]
MSDWSDWCQKVYGAAWSKAIQLKIGHVVLTILVVYIIGSLRNSELCPITLLSKFYVLLGPRPRSYSSLHRPSGDAQNKTRESLEYQCDNTTTGTRRIEVRPMPSPVERSLRAYICTPYIQYHRMNMGRRQDHKSHRVTPPDGNLVFLCSSGDIMRR